MTRKDAIVHLAHKIIGCKTTGESGADGVAVEALEMATQALQKQEPQRVRKTEIEYICKCPACGKDVIGSGYCWNCGQHLDWGREKNDDK